MRVAARLHRTARKGHAAESVSHRPGSSRNTKTVNQQKIYAIPHMDGSIKKFRTFNKDSGGGDDGFLKMTECVEPRTLTVIFTGRKQVR
jgi:hypothetical protein